MPLAIAQSLGIAISSLLAALAGVWFARRQSPAWLMGFLAPLLLVLLIGLTRRFYPLNFVFPFYLLTAGRREFALIGPLAAMMMDTPIARLPDRRTRIVCSLFVAAFIVQAAILPFLMPAIQRPMMAALATHIDSTGVCRQSTDYTCGPAAAVTALRAVGIDASEADLAVLAYTSRSTGTEPDVLADVLQAKFGDRLDCTYRPFNNAQELPTDRPTIVLINYKFLVDHYVTVLSRTDHDVEIGDPLSGRTRETFADFESDWRHVGIVLTPKK